MGKIRGGGGQGRRRGGRSDRDDEAGCETLRACLRRTTLCEPSIFLFFFSDLVRDLNVN